MISHNVNCAYKTIVQIVKHILKVATVICKAEKLLEEKGLNLAQKLLMK